jgi:2-dehydro-3-deoxyphosphogluconate aldolase/(4S)-4-hydroxy-2-oxoglutarate aldolase
MLPLYFNADETVTIEILRAIYRAGIKAVEYTSRGESALSNFTKMVAVRNVEMPDLLLGIGTIKNLQQAQEYFVVELFLSVLTVPVGRFLKKEFYIAQAV